MRSTLVHFEVRGVKNDVLVNFTKSVIFDTIIQSMKITKIHSELSRIVRKPRTSERIVEMSEIARLNKRSCSSRTDACMKGSRASNTSWKNARECFASPSHLRLESERHKSVDCEADFTGSMEQKIGQSATSKKDRSIRIECSPCSVCPPSAVIKPRAVA